MSRATDCAATKSPGEDFRVLVLDDSRTIRHLLAEILQSAGYSVETAGTLGEARDSCRASSFDLVLVDRILPDGSGLDLAKELTEDSADCEVVLITGEASVESAVQAIQLGVADYITKPFEDTELLLARVQRVAQTLALKRKNRALFEELQRKNAELEALSTRDSLTRLYNHAHLQDSLEREIQRCARHGLSLGLMLVGFDHFQQVNEEFGHQSGDRLLKFIAEILEGQARRSDLGFCLDYPTIAARYGGDVFAVLLPEAPKRGAAARAERFRAWSDGFDFDSVELPRVTVSIGVAAYPEDADDRAHLIDAADAAMYAAKRGGGNRMVSFTPALLSQTERLTVATDELERLAALDALIRQRNFKFVYQPIVNARTTEVIGYEALCRPLDPAFSDILDLLGTAERAGRINDLGVTLRDVATAELERLPEPFLLFVNLHPLELNDQLLAWGDAQPGANRIVLEVTETAAIQESSAVHELLAQLRALGFRIALDDLGAGYAGLGSLVVLEPDFIKLDMSMLRGIHSDSRSARLIHHLLDFANGEGMQVIAEGIETTEERQVVTDLGCHLLQGYLFARPSPPFCEVQVA